MVPSFVTPIPGAVVTSGWLSPREYRDGYHYGLDFRASIGTPVRAVADGLVTTAKDVSTSNAGKWIGISHPGGWVTRYLHLNDLTVKQGQSVRAGQLIGHSGATGITQSAAHLHFDVAVDNLSKYPYPTPGMDLIGKQPQGWPVPAEPLIPASFSATVVAAAKKLGIPLAAAGVGALLLLGGLGLFLLWRLRTR